MSIIQALRRPDYELWLKAIDKERLDLGDYFLDGIPALERVPRSDVPRGAWILKSIIRKAKWTETPVCGVLL